MATRLLTSLLVLVSISALVRARDTQQKGGIRMPVRKVATNVKRDGARVSYSEQTWAADMSISGQDLTMRVATEGGITWVASTLMSFQNQSRMTTGQIFNPHTSPNYQRISGYTFTAEYNIGNLVTGPMATDEVQIGGLTLPDFPFGVCSNWTNTAEFAYGVDTISTSGMLGLAFSGQVFSSPRSERTFMEILLPSLPAPIFTTSFTATGGFLDFGFVDDAAYTGNLTKLPIDNTTHFAPGTWLVHGVQLGSNGRLFNDHTPVQMVLSTEQNLITLPPPAFREYLGQVPGANFTEGNDFSTYPCGTPLPNLEYTFTTAAGGPVTASIPGEKLKLAGANSTCKIVVSPLTGANLLGGPFIIDRYLVWNYSEPSVSFADATGEGSTTPPPSTNSSSLSTGARAGIGVAVAAFGLALIAAGLFLYRKKRRSRLKAAGADSALEGKPEVNSSTVEAREIRGGDLCEVPGHSKPFELTADKTYELYGEGSLVELSAGYESDEK